MNPLVTANGTGERFIFPGAIELEIIIPTSATNGTLAIFEDIVEPGAGPGRHIHKEQDETFFIIEGTFDIEADGQLHHVKGGDTVFVPRGTAHAFKNVGQTRGRLRYAFTPAGKVEQMFRTFHNALQQGGLDQEAMARIAADHGQEFVGPPL